MLLRATASCLLSFLLPAFLYSQVPVGSWREHLPYRQAISVAEGMNKVFCATPYSLFSVDLGEGSIERMSKVNGLSETGVSAIAMDKENSRLVIAYDNSNIDIVSNNVVINISALKKKEISADKRVYSIACIGDQAYLCTGLGLVVIDLEKLEIRDTYVIGEGGEYAKLTGFAADDDYYYAASEEGLKRALKNGINLADYRNWELVNGAMGLPDGTCNQVVSLGRKMVARLRDSLFILQEGRWSLFYTNDWKIVDCNVSSDKLLVCQRGPGAESRVVALNPDGTTDRIMQQHGLEQPNQVILVNNEAWIADRFAGLLQYSESGSRQFQPNSPDSVSTGEMVFAGNSLWVAAGAAGSPGTGHINRKGFSQFLGNEWINYNGKSLPGADSLYDFVSIAVDPVSRAVWAGSFTGGLLQLQPGKPPVVYKQFSFIDPDAAGNYRVSGLNFDTENNLWIANYGAPENVAVRKPDGSWKKFAIPFPHSGNAVSQIIIDDDDQKWIISPNGNGLFCFNHGNSLENIGDDRWKFFREGAGNGNLPDNHVYCMAKDKNGFIWIGTRRGIGIVNCTQHVFSVQGCEVVLPVVQQDNFAGYLFRDEEVQAIAVDGADRKWVGTKRGVWLISPDGEKTIHRFTVSNSPLLDDDVRAIAIDPAGGDIYFETVKGICSFRGTATEAGAANTNLLVFPNPVPPGYTGQIAIRGLVNNALVKITELDGRLVYQTRANGGQAVWNGLDYKGRQVSTGVYLVLVTDDTRKENIAGKIVFVR